MARIKACGVPELGPGSVRQVVLDNGKAIAVYRIDDGFFASDDLCSHGQAYLSEGDIEDGNIVCPFHGGMFDIKTGDATAAPCIVPIKTYPVSVENDSLFIELDSDS